MDQHRMWRSRCECGWISCRWSSRWKAQERLHQHKISKHEGTQ